MTAARTTSLLPPIPEPPHDPTWWLLDARAGWQEAELLNVEAAPLDQALALAPEADSLRSLTEPSGSFGGLTLPTGTAYAADGSVYLLDASTLQLKRFDPCRCRFDVVPCFGGEGAGARQLRDPHGLGVRGGTLFVCDTGNHRLSLFALPEGVLRGHWAPPPAAALPHPWTPHDVAFDGRGRVFVTDPANGRLHRFSPSGLWEGAFAGFGLATHVAVDCRERIYVVIEGEKDVRVVDTLGEPLEAPARVDALRGAFTPLPFEVDAEGGLHLAGLCTDPPPASEGRVVVFDAKGDPIAVEATGAGPRFEREGLYVTRALDSALYRCQWHRIVLRGDVPSGTSLTVSTHAAQAPQPAEQILNLPEAAWRTNLVVRSVGGDAWDGLVRSGPGRYLWLRIRFRGHGRATPRLQSIKVEFPRISLRRYLPSVFGEDPVGADFTDRLLSVFDTTLRSVEKHIDTQARLFDPLSTPVERDPATGLNFLSWLASWIGVTLEQQWPEKRRRRLLKTAGRLFALRGTREGLWRQLLFYLGMEPESVCCTHDRPKERCRPVPVGCARPEPLPCAWQPPPLILEHFQLRRWLFLGAGRLGDQAVLWGRRIVGRSQLDENAQAGGTRLMTTPDPLRDPFHVYAHTFSVFVPAAYGRSQRHRRTLENLIRAEKPAHTQAQFVFVEPRFRIGFQSMIGLDSVIGCYPEGVPLGETTLGAASVLGQGMPEAPSLRVGDRARIGTTTMLD